MANWSRMSYARLVSAAHTLYTNARANPDIVAEMTEFGYTAPDDYDAGLALLADAHAATGTLAAEQADALAATAASDRATDRLQARFIADRRRARRAHPSGTDGYSSLHLAGDAPRAEADLIQAAATFYNTLTSRPDLAAPIRRMPPERIAESLALVAAARDADAAQAREDGEAQRASQLRKQAISALRAHAAEMAASAEEALEDHPQLRETLGLLERS